MLAPLKETVERYKTNPEEVAAMCAELEKWSQEERAEGFEKGLAKGRIEGRFEGKIAAAKALLQKHIPVEEIAEVTGLSAKDIETLS